MNKILPFFLLITFFLSCNKYEVLEPSITVKIHAVNIDTKEIYVGYKGIIRSSDFSLSLSSSSFFEDIQTVRYDSALVNNNGDLLFEIPFVNGIPQRYYELSLSKGDETTITEGRFLNEYVQSDTFQIGDLTQLDVKVRNDSCRLLSFSTLGYQTKEDYQRDSSRFFINPDYVARLGITNSKDTVISKILPFSCNNYIVFQLIDRSVSPPLVIKYDVIEATRDSITQHCIFL